MNEFHYCYGKLNEPLTFKYHISGGPHTMASSEDSPLQVERNELGYSLEPIRDGRALRVIHRPCPASEVCLFLVHGGGGRAGQFKHLIRKFENV